MALQSSGEIDMLDIVAEFGGSVPHSLSEYYRKLIRLMGRQKKIPQKCNKGGDLKKLNWTY